MGVDPVKTEEISGPPGKGVSPKIVFESEYDRNPLSFLGKPWVQKTAFWLLLLGVLMYLRSFFALIFLTFLFSVLMEAVVRRIPNLIPSRRGRTVMVFVLLLAFWAGLFYFMVPRIATEFERAMDQLPKLSSAIQTRLEELRDRGEKPEKENGEPDKRKEQAGPEEKADQTQRDTSGDGLPPVAGRTPEPTGSSKQVAPAPAPDPALPDSKVPDPAKPAEHPPGAAEAKHEPDATRAGPGGADQSQAAAPKKKRGKWDLIIDALGLKEALTREKVQAFVNEQSKTLLGYVPSVVSHLVWAVFAFLLSLIFSFLIVLDFPRLVDGYYKLEQTRAGPFFQVARETFSPFGQVLAQALGAQTVIALVNTALTAIGLALLGVPSIEVLSVIVFLCSFIPVAGVFISSVPLAMVALGHNGFGNMLLLLGLVTLVHQIEAYILNPRIYGAHLRMNPLVVLILLFVAHNLLGLWGVVLATPVAAYVFHHVLKFPEKEVRLVEPVEPVEETEPG
jgi:predicted PurR-regulated permease PerM